MLRFTEALEDVGDAGKGRSASYAGVLELLIGFERAASDLEARIAALHAERASMKQTLSAARSSLARATEFARSERERVEQSIRVIAPLAQETNLAYPQLRAACGGKKAPRECAAILERLRLDEDAGPTEFLRAADQLAAVRVSTPAVAAARDRAVAATRAFAKAALAELEQMGALTKRWGEVQKSVTEAFSGLDVECKDIGRDLNAQFVADPKPDPRKLTVLVRVKPPAGVGETFEELAAQAKDADTRAFYQARARGGSGSGFIVVRVLPSGAAEPLVITNRHVVELTDRASLELADGTTLGPADIVYTDLVHDIAVLRPANKLPVTKGFSFAVQAAKDQQGVIATGFPGMAGRPSYQTTRGYVSNESFRMEESARTLVYVQHTAPIDPGSSGGPLTDERGNVIGVNTMKVSHREAVGLAVPAQSILETLRRADAAESKHASASERRTAARLSCLGLVGELASKKPRMLVLETMISNGLTGTEGLEAARAIDDDTFEQLWLSDSVRAMRIATLLRVRTAVAASGGTNPLETCSDMKASEGAGGASEEVRFRMHLGNWETREIAFRWEQGHYKLARIDLRAPSELGVGKGGSAGASSRASSSKSPPSSASRSAPRVSDGARAKPKKR